MFALVTNTLPSGKDVLSFSTPGLAEFAAQFSFAHDAPETTAQTKFLRVLEFVEKSPKVVESALDLVKTPQFTSIKTNPVLSASSPTYTSAVPTSTITTSATGPSSTTHTSGAATTHTTSAPSTSHTVVSAISTSIHINPTVVS